MEAGRDRLAHRLDLLWAKGFVASMWTAILADGNSLSVVISPTLDFQSGDFILAIVALAFLQG